MEPWTSGRLRPLDGSRQPLDELEGISVFIELNFE
jgi:hypothetical protein